MIIGDGRRKVSLTCDGVDVYYDGVKRDFFPWGSGEGEDAQARQMAQAAQETADDAATAASGAQETADDAATAASGAQETADDAVSVATETQAALEGYVKKNLEEPEYVQTVGKTIRSQGDINQFGWNLGQNSAANQIYFELNATDRDDAKNVRFRADVLQNSGEARFYTRHGPQAECNEASLKATRTSAFIQLKNLDGDTLTLSSDFTITMTRAGETRALDLWDLAGA